ncbi:MAG: translesion DNA synthesis-associated protein ImuA [Gammaproteobacteria bacterium]|nr:translesion DNA synthesis-associated protein ImuA [Gammaproteobacteria bacterium]
MPHPLHRPADHAALLASLALLCRGTRVATTGTATTPSGLAALDTVLPDGGWPRGAITELLADAAGIGELSLLLPALASLNRAGLAHAWISPPYLPGAAGLLQGGIDLARLLLIATHDERETLWAAEQALRCSGMGAVLLWPAAPTDRCVRRLQLAAESAGSLGFLFRPAAAATAPSPAALRLRLTPHGTGLEVRILKARGGHPHAVVVHPVATAGA